MTKVLVTGAGGFIGGHLTRRLLKDKFKVVAVDIKPFKYWFQKFSSCKNYSLDLKNYNNCLKVTKNVKYIFNLACNMGGMGFIENHKAECMLSVLINTNLLRASVANKVKKYLFTSSACIYNTTLQKKTFVQGLKEEDAYPANPEDGYGWEKLFSERMCRHFYEDFGLETRVARYHNVYGPIGTYDGGREKAPAAICRKISLAKINKKKSIEIWGDGKQSRSFLYIDDCIEGTLKLFKSRYKNPLNIGSDQQISINQLVDIVEKLSKNKFKRKYLLNKPKGVRGRSSNNRRLKKVLRWNYKVKIKEGLKKTYLWIFDEICKNRPTSKRFKI